MQQPIVVSINLQCNASHTLSLSKIICYCKCIIFFYKNLLAYFVECLAKFKLYTYNTFLERHEDVLPPTLPQANYSGGFGI